jgi:hypothetical protein
VVELSRFDMIILTFLGGCPSESLKERFNSDSWTNAKLGNFIVVYGTYNGKIARIIK